MSLELLDKHYQPQSIEQNHYQHWEENGFFKATDNDQPYCIMLPPPNVTGTLHMGHAFQHTIIDILIRYHRMRGYSTLWQPGTDHAGIATQMVVERQLNEKNLTRQELGRDRFVEKVWQWKETSGGKITQQLRRMGISADWSRARFTMDDELTEAVQNVFIRLYEQGLIYRGKRLVNWDPVLQTAVSDLEVISEEEEGKLWQVHYPFSDNPEEKLTVATTRPETILGDSAVAVHPEDDRYRHLIGKTLRLPLTDRIIPIIADDYVDPEFGSGCVKITPAHDFNDYEVGLRHNLPQHNIFDPQANIDIPDSPYHGMDRYQAREQIIDDLRAEHLLHHADVHMMMVPRGDRSNSVIEPYLTDQWFVDVDEMAKTATEVVESGEIRFMPDNWKNTYYEWMNNIKDWCISRQLWWGHRIPAWYDDQGHVYVAKDHEDALKQAREKGAKDDVILRQDDDVLDTWFSSALWPFSTLGWLNNAPEYEKFYPTSVLVTGFDIIFFWVARMIMFGKKFTGKIPFHEVYIHGLVRDQEGQKMSKSKGNVLDPIDLIDGISLDDLITKRTSGMMQPHLSKKIEDATRRQYPNGIPAYGTDALRLSFASLATLGRDVRFDLSRIEGNRNFCNKLWNAARFVLMQMNENEMDLSGQDRIFGLEEKWILSACQEIAQLSEQHIKTYRFDLLSQTLYGFIWQQYCSWYLEMAKITLNRDDVTEQRKRGTKYTLVSVMDTLLRLLHPIMPFITEEIWQKIHPYLVDTEENINSIMVASYPKYDESKVDVNANENIEWMQSMVTAIRNLRSEKNIEPNKRLILYVDGLKDADYRLLDTNGFMLTALAKLDDIKQVDETFSLSECASIVNGHLTLSVRFGDLIDVSAEKKRLQQAIAKTDKDIEKLENILNNPGFMDRAPEAVKNKHKTEHVELIEKRDQLRLQYDKVCALK